MADIYVYALYATPLSAGAILFGRSDTYGFAVASDPTKFFWDKTNHYLGLGTSTPLATLHVEGTALFNDAGLDRDVRMEGLTDSNLFFLDAGNDRIGIGTNAPGAKLDVRGGAIFNEDGASVDFRIESNSNTHMFFLDGSANKIGINQSVVTHVLDINGDLACTYLYGQTQTQNADDTLYLGDTTNFNFFLDKNKVGGQIIIGYNTPKQTTSAGSAPFTIFDNSTDRNDIFCCVSPGVAAGRQREVVVNEGSVDCDFRAEGNTDENLLLVDASTDRVGIGVIPTQKLDVNGIALLRNKLAFTQVDLNEYIDSLASGYLDIGATTAIRLKAVTIAEDAIYFTQTDGNEKIDSLNDGYMDYCATTAHRFNTPIRGTTSLWWRANCFDVISLSPGASAATWTDADANHLAGYQLNAVDEYLYLTTSIHSDWDAASDIEIKVTFEILAAGANATDTVDIAARCHYKGVGDTATKTQTPETAVVIGTAAQYTQFTATIIIDHDLAGNVVDIGDKMTIRLNLETDTSEVDDILISLVNVRYKTAKMNPEV